MKLIFMASGELACPSLEALLGSPRHTLLSIVTQPDRPKGRRLERAPCAVKARAAPHGIPILTPENVNAPETVAALQSLAPDVIVVIAYGQLLRKDVLAVPRRAFVNVHPSLLPRYRGAAPVVWAIARGETETGVSTMHVSARMDAGDVILQRRTPIGPDDTGGALSGRLAREGAELLLETLERLEAGTAPRVPQDESRVTLAPRLSREDGILQWAWPASTLHNRVRAFNPWPACTAELPGVSGGAVKVLRTRVEPGAGEIGMIVEAAGEGPLIQAGADRLRLLELQPPGRKPMPGSAFLNGHRLEVGRRCL